MNIVYVLTSHFLQVQARALLIYIFLQAFLKSPPHDISGVAGRAQLDTCPC